MLLACGLSLTRNAVASTAEYRSGGNGFALEVSATWPDAGGYRPVRITLRPTAVQPGVRNLVIRFSVRDPEALPPQTTHVTQAMEVPAGTAPASIVIAVPQTHRWESMRCEISENGDVLQPLSGQWTNVSQNIYVWPEFLPNMLFVSDGTPAFPGLVRSLPRPQQYVSQLPGGETSYLDRGVLPGMQYRTLSALPDRWIEYSSLDIVVIDLEQLKQLQNAHPEKWRALTDWVRAGGNLWIGQAGTPASGASRFRRLPEIDGLLGTRPADWQTPRKEAQIQHRNETQAITQQQMEYIERSVAVDQAAVESQSGNGDDAAGDRFRSATVGLGFVAGITGDPLLLTSGDVGSLLGTMTSRRYRWTERHAVSMMRGNPEITQFGIPGVGDPPVVAFYILITLFVVLIGPINYFFLRRTHRLYMMTATVPLLAFMVTIGLVSYALISDGFGVRARCRSLTWLDQRQGHAATWNLSCYYAGLAPSSGLTFSPDSAVIPVELFPEDDSTRQRSMLWEDDQKLLEGYLPSRTPKHFLSIRSRPSQKRLDVAFTGTTCEVTNKLEVTLNRVVVRNEAGQCFMTGQAIAPGAKVVLQPIDPFQARDAIYDALAAIDVTATIPVVRYGRNSYRYYQRQQYMQMSNTLPTLATSILERNYEQVRSDLPKGHFVALAAESPEAEIGLPGVQQEHSVHLLIGNW